MEADPQELQDPLTPMKEVDEETMFPKKVENAEAITEDEIEKKLEKPDLTINTATVFPDKHSYLLTTWRRCPFDPNRFPQCLNGAKNAACLSNVDSEFGVLWQFIPRETFSTAFSLKCIETDKACWLTDNLTMAESEEDAAIFRFTQVGPFRGLPGDVSIRITHVASDLLLCSNDITQALALLTESQADTKNPNGDYVMNLAWEVHPEDLIDDGDDWLDQYTEVDHDKL
ncbi:hypothetical protein J8273_1312 [Carpediemonas membranifera]|uniref:Uncharacterized protein n=1 Tax=Carpediemonas membranifera TaxID=201153 RepID=A0A8J6B9G2_9EUKA|nr:hypothetical protein J8273_1312 [Carpediemonas membranifera]|eukprot:KAG9396964.1 hypothetical protein J8273_1312 [Carpediemonas membranifera]